MVCVEFLISPVSPSFSREARRQNLPLRHRRGPTPRERRGAPARRVKPIQLGGVPHEDGLDRVVSADEPGVEDELVEVRDGGLFLDGAEGRLVIDERPGGAWPGSRP